MRKILFHLDVEDGFPPEGSETLNAEPLGKRQYRLANTPFLVEGISLGDVVEAHEAETGRLVFERVLESASCHSLSVLLFDVTLRARLASFLEQLGCYVEYGEFPGLNALAVSVPQSADYEAIKMELIKHESANRVSFAELALADSSSEN